MFWGLIVEPGKKYSQKVFQPFHISQAVLDVTIIKGDPNVQLILSSTIRGNGDIINTIDHILCVLKKSGTVQVPLNLRFSEGDDVSFRSVGGTVHLSGCLVDSRLTGRRQMAQESGDEGDDSDEDSSEEEDRSDDEDDTGRRRIAQESDSDEDSSEQEDRSDDEDNSDNDSMKEEQPPKKKFKPNEIPEERKEPKVVENKIRQLGGVRIEDMRKGKGPAVKSGNKVGICFNCTLQSNNISIHKHSSGQEYKFTVGKGEVIQGWDIGIVGMRPGGKRKLICPPKKAFGAKGTQPAIPPDATLVYEIELKRVF